MLPLVADGGRVETTAGTLVSGVPLTARADSTGVVVALLTCAVALAILAEARRSPLERSGLLLCVGGTVCVCLAGNAVLLVTGLELGNAGALLLGVGATRAGDAALRRRAEVAFGVQHVASLGLLAASLQLLHAQGTDDLAALPPGAVGTAVALPWALCGAVRLLAGAGVTTGAGARTSPAWLPLAAVPGGLVVLLRLGDVTGGAVGDLTPALLTAAGLAAAVAGAFVAARNRQLPAVAGRALLLSAGGQVVALIGDGAAGTTVAATAGGIALVLAAAAAPAWSEGAATGARLSALGLAAASGLPTAAGMTALLAGCGAEVASGGGRAVIGVFAALAGVAAAGAGGAAALRALSTAPAGDEGELPPRSGRLPARPDVALALAASFVLALLPGVFLGGIADRAAGGTLAVTAIDAGAVLGPGFGWAGGYLTVALAVATIAALAAARLQGIPIASLLRAPMPAQAEAPPPFELRWPAAEELARFLRGLRRVDGWLARQPDLPAIILTALACLIWFQYRP
jgi:hypothetical protein